MLLAANPGRHGRPKDDAVEVFNFCSNSISFFLGLFWFAAFAAIELYMKLDCGAGCAPWVWPNANDIIRADERFDASHWPNGTEFCYPVSGSSAEGTDEGTKGWSDKFPLGPAVSPRAKRSSRHP